MRAIAPWGDNGALYVGNERRGPELFQSELLSSSIGLATVLFGLATVCLFGGVTSPIVKQTHLDRDGERSSAGGHGPRSSMASNPPSSSGGVGCRTVRGGCF